MSVGDVTGGLDTFDEDQAVQNLASVGAGLPREPPPQVDAVSGGPVPLPVSQTPGNELATPDFSEPEHLQPGQGGVDVYNLGNPNEPEPLGTVPQPPTITGNHEQDVQNNLQYSRDLAAYGSKLQQYKGTFDKKQAAIDERKAADLAAAQRQAIAQRVAFEAAKQKRLADREAEIDRAASQRAAYAKDLEGHDKVNGGQIVALIAGAFGAALQNYGQVLRGGQANAPNQAAIAIDTINKRDYDRKLARLQASSEALKEARYGYKDEAENMRAGLNDLDADYAAKQKLIIADAEAQGRKNGVPMAELANNAIILKAQQEYAAAVNRIHEREEELQQKRQSAAATNALAQAHLEQGERQIAATQGYHTAELGLRASEGAANRSERRFEHEIALADRLDRQRDKKTAEADQAAAKKKAEDEKLEVRDGSGVVRGLAPSTRVVKQVQDRIVQYDDSIEALQELKNYVRQHQILGRLPTGDEYNRAVLAVAATTTANSSDSTTAHEANTLKNIGLTSPDAVERTLQHQLRRQAKFMKQLRPVEGGETAPPPPVANRQLRLPDGSIAEFDATGKRVK
jgi:hypothetical protein